MNSNIQKIEMEDNSYSSSSSDDRSNNAALLVALSCITGVLFQNNVSSHNIRSKNTIPRGRIEVERLLI